MSRPLVYRPEFCEEVIDFLGQGFSLTAFAGSKRVTRQAVYLWTKEYPEFGEAVEIGKAAAVHWWEIQNQNLARTGQGNATACVFGLKNRAREDWQDVNRTEHAFDVGSALDAIPDA